MNDKTQVAMKLKELFALTDSFCAQYADDEYRDVCQALLRKMSRKRVVPFMQGNNSTWAGGVVHAIGTINFLFDPKRVYEKAVRAEGAAQASGILGAEEQRNAAYSKTYASEQRTSGTTEDGGALWAMGKPCRRRAFSYTL